MGTKFLEDRPLTNSVQTSKNLICPKWDFWYNPDMSESEIIQKKIQAIADRIAAEYKPEKIILFGSYAWGKPHKDSDLDFFIIKKTSDPMLKRSMDVDRLFFPREFAMDFLVYTPKQIKERKQMGDSFIIDILDKGKLLYAK